MTTRALANLPLTMWNDPGGSGQDDLPLAAVTPLICNAFSVPNYLSCTFASSAIVVAIALDINPVGTATIPSPIIRITNVNILPPAVTGYISP